MKMRFLSLFLLAFVNCEPAFAHHSYAVYDIDNKIGRTGVLTRFVYGQPHIEMELIVENTDGSTELWSIESTSPQRWERMGHPRNIAEPGEIVTIEGWPARNGYDEMLLSSITTDRGKTVIIDKVKQPRARTGIPETTVKRN